MKILKRFLMEQDMPQYAGVCYQCGVCAGGCPVGEFQWDFNPRRLIGKILRDELDDIVNDNKIWLCASCHTCLERCPQKIEVSEIMVQLKNAAARMGNIPENEIKMVLEIMKNGWLQNPGKRILQIRQELGLPEMPAGISSSELHEMVEHMGLHERVDIRKKTGAKAPDDSGENSRSLKKEETTG
jgi:heterodisulfide reductase subunit C